MKKHFLRGLLTAGALFAMASLAQAQLVEFRATVNAAQETPASTSPATGTAVMLYNVATNLFDITITINNFSNTITASHIHEGAPGVAGPVVTNFGSETVYTRNGNTLTATFRGVTHGGTKLTLLQNWRLREFPLGHVSRRRNSRPAYRAAQAAHR
jgi:hypothetical protein